MSKKPSSGSVRVLSMAVVTALAIGFASARPATAQAGYVVEDLGALAGDTSSVGLGHQRERRRGGLVQWARRARAPSCTRMPAAWSRCPACRTSPGRWPVTSTTRASSSARPTRAAPTSAMRCSGAADPFRTSARSAPATSARPGASTTSARSSAGPTRTGAAAYGSARLPVHRRRTGWSTSHRTATRALPWTSTTRVR